MKIQLTEQARKELFPGRFKPLYWALFVYLALMPVAYGIATIAPGRKDWPFWGFAAGLHALLCALLCALVGTVGKLIVNIVECWFPHSRWRPYTGAIRNFIAILAVWPFCFAIFMLIWKLKHG